MKAENGNSDTEWLDKQIAAIQRKKHPTICSLVKTRDQIQKLRIATANRMDAMERVNLDCLETAIAAHGLICSGLVEMEDEIAGEWEKEVKEHPLWIEWLSQVKGIGLTTTGNLIGLIDDVGRFDTISKLWAYVGLRPDDKKKKGEAASWDHELKAFLLGTVFPGLMRAKGSYYDLYHRIRENYDEKHPDKTDGHRHNMARRKVMKLFLSHLYQTWREIEGLPVRDPYPIEQQQHTTQIMPLIG